MADRLGNLPLPSGAGPDKDCIHSLETPPLENKDSISAGPQIVDLCAREAGLEFFPNDLTRMLYLASLRDCNSGCYLHPTLSPRLGAEMADQGLRACHLRIFLQLLTQPLSAYVGQLDEYIRYTRTEKRRVLETWQCLQAYRATTPVLESPLYRELFCWNVEAALLVLENQSATPSGR